MSRQNVTVGLLTGHTTLTAHMFNLGSTQRLFADYAERKKKVRYLLVFYVIALHWHAKDTELWVICF
jgi:hypothetical protein